MRKIIKNCLYILLMSFISPILLATSKSDHYSSYFFPNHFDKGNNDTAALLPKNHAHIFSLPFSNTNKVLRVYFSPWFPEKDDLSSNYNESLLKLIKTGIWGEQFDASEYKAYLFVYNPQENSSTYLGVINPESQTGNSGALYVPFAIRGDNKAIILQAWMGSPGAGGGSTDYGYALMPIIITNKSAVINDYILRRIATDNAVFYDHFSKVIYIGEGRGTTASCGNFPTNDAVYYRDLLHPTKKKILAEKSNTIYSHIMVDEISKTVTFVATSYFNVPYDSCPQEVYPQTLLRSKSIRQVMKLP